MNLFPHIEHPSLSSNAFQRIKKIQKGKKCIENYSQQPRYVSLIYNFNYTQVKKLPKRCSESITSKTFEQKTSGYPLLMNLISWDAGKKLIQVVLEGTPKTFEIIELFFYAHAPKSGSKSSWEESKILSYFQNQF